MVRLQRVVQILLLASGLAACAHGDRLRLPLTLAGADGSWNGLVRGCRFDMVVGGQAVGVERADVLSLGPNFLLLNSQLSGGRYAYVNTWVEAGVCTIRQRRYPYKAEGCLTDGSPQAPCLVRFDGCASHAGPGQVQAFARAAGLPQSIPRPPQPGRHPYSCRPGFKQSAAAPPSAGLTR